jgi:HlyD family secretion protein
VRGQNNNAAAYQTTTVQRGTLTSTVEGSGTVRSALSTSLTWLTSGQVDQVNTLIGDEVNAGDILATLFQSSLPQDVLLASSNLVTAQRNLDTAQNSGTSRAQAQVTLFTAQQSYDSAKATYDMLVSQSHGWATTDIQNLQAKVTIAQNQVDRAQNAYNGLSGLPDDNPQKAQAYTSLYSAKQALSTAKANLNYALLTPSTTNIEKAKANLALAQAQLEDAQRAWDLVENGLDQNTISAAEAQLVAAQQTVDKAQISAPFDGTITQAEAIPNAIVSPGTQAFRIDDLSNLVIDVQVVEIDINHVKVGQPATIIFDAIPNKTYTGKVIKTDLSGTETNSSVTFSVTVQLVDADAMVKPGMAANITITTNQVENALLIPGASIFTDTTGQQYVYLVQNGKLTTVPVTTGAVSDSATQITNDTLQEGDLIVLSFASTSSSSSGFGFMGGPGAGARQSEPTP